MDLLSFSVLARQQETVLWSYSAIPHNCAVFRQSCLGGTLVTGGRQQEKLALGGMENVTATCA